MTRFRRYGPGDFAACWKVFFHAVNTGAAAFYDEAQRRAWAPSEDPDYTKPDKLAEQYCWLAEQDSRVVGFMSLEPSGYLDMAFVMPEVMGTGVADELYARLLDDARAAGLTRLTVHASHLARRFFAKQGWRVDEMEHHEANGQTYERFAMSLELT